MFFNNFLLSPLGIWILASVSGVCFALIGSSSETVAVLVFRKSSAHILLSQDINIMIFVEQCFPWLQITSQANFKCVRVCVCSLFNIIMRQNKFDKAFRTTLLHLQLQ